MAVVTPRRDRTDATQRPASRSATTWQRFTAHRPALIGLITLALILVLSLVAPLILRVDSASPASTIWASALYAGRWSLLIALAVVVIGDGIGWLLGTIAGSTGGFGGALIMRVADALLAWPILPIVLVLIAIWQPGVPGLIVILALVRWPTSARAARDRVADLRQQPFIEHAQAINASSADIMTSHLLPHAWAPVAVNAALGIGSVVMIESTLSYLGFGAPAGVLTWGSLLRAVDPATFGSAPLALIAPGVLIVLVALSSAAIAYGLRAALRTPVHL